MARFELITSPFPWRDGNRFQLLIDGDQFFPAMLNAIASAEIYVLMEMYLVESGVVADRFISSLLDAANRGVMVFLLLDDFGAMGLHQTDRNRLQHDNIAVIYFNRLHYGKWQYNLFRNHRKLLLTDGRLAFVGGAGITDEFDPPLHVERRWRETMVAIEGRVVSDWQDLFISNWRHTADKDLELPRLAPRAEGHQQGRVCYSRGILYPEIKRTAIVRIRNARKRVWLATAYFVPSMKFRRALRRAARRGADVRLLVPGDHTDHPAIRHAGRRFYYRLLHHGVRIYEYQPRFTHSKVLVCDNWISIGSSNLDRWTLRWNLEANLEVDDIAFSEEACRILEHDFEQSREFQFSEWANRPWYRRWQEDFWGWVDIWLERISRPSSKPRPPE